MCLVETAGLLLAYMSGKSLMSLVLTLESEAGEKLIEIESYRSL